MKKIYNIFSVMALCLLVSTTTKSQTFTVAKDTVEFVPYAYVDVYNNVTNATADTIHLNWRIFNHTMPQVWKEYAAFGLCDNQLCYDTSILGGSTQTSLPIAANATDLFKLQLDGSNSNLTPSSTQPFYISVELSHSTTVDTVVFAFRKWATNVKSVQGVSANVSVYPNPAQSDLNVTFDRSMGVEKVAIYNLIGKKVKSYRVTGESAKLNISDTPSGIYFVRFMNNSGQVLATRRFTHQ